MSDIRIEKIDLHQAEKRIEDFSSFSARSVWIDGDEVLVLIYGNGPTPHINAVEHAIDIMLVLAAAKGSQP